MADVNVCLDVMGKKLVRAEGVGAHIRIAPVFVNEAPGFSPSGVDEVIDLLLLGIHPEQDRHRPARVGRYVVQAIHCLDRFADPG